MVKKQSSGNFNPVEIRYQKHQRGGNFKGGKHQRSQKNQIGGAAGLALAAGLAIPALLGAATKILPGIFGKKKAAPVTNHNYNGQKQQQQYRQPPRQQYRPSPQYYRPQTQQYSPSPQYYPPQTQPYYFRQPRRPPPPPRPYRRRRRYTRQKGGRVSRPKYIYKIQV